MAIIKTDNGIEYEIGATVEIKLIEKTPPGPLSMTPREQQFIQDRIATMVAPLINDWIEAVLTQPTDEEPPKPRIIV
jgi:hypothetical protein